MLVALQVQFTVALVDFPILVRLGGVRGRNTGDGLLFLFQRVRLNRDARSKGDVPVDAQDLQPLQRGVRHQHAMRDASGVPQVRRRLIYDQVGRVHGFADGPPTDRTEIDLFERSAAEPEHQQHAIGVRVVFRRRGRQVVVQVLFQRVRQPVLLGCGTDGVISDLHRAVGRQHLGSGVRLETQQRLQQQGVPDATGTGHAVRVARGVADLGAQSEQLQPLGAGFDVVLSARHVLADAAQQVVGDAPEFPAVQTFREIVVPTGRGVVFVVHQRLAIQRNGHSAVVVFQFQHD